MDRSLADRRKAEAHFAIFSIFLKDKSRIGMVNPFTPGRAIWPKSIH